MQLMINRTSPVQWLTFGTVRNPICKTIMQYMKDHNGQHNPSKRIKKTNVRRNKAKGKLYSPLLPWRDERGRSFVPVEHLSHTSKPITIAVIGGHARHRVFRWSDLRLNPLSNPNNQRISPIQCFFELPIKTNRRSASTVHRHFNAQHRTIREQHLSEWERVWANRCH